MSHTAQALRSELEVEALCEVFPFDVLVEGRWTQPKAFDEARQLIDGAPGDPVITAVDYHR